MDVRALALLILGMWAVGLSGCESMGSTAELRQALRPPSLVGVPEQYEPPVMPENSNPPK